MAEVVVSPESISEPGVTSLSIEKTLRAPANFFDPVRMLTSYPGVVTANDQANSIIVKGYSPMEFYGDYKVWISLIQTTRLMRVHSATNPLPTVGV
ncbi:MAG: hypothetical protein IPK96_13045 [Flammeovirgaceae bacterium]|nr:hypothetical protein [Flammeovirgaceae bacterium]